MALMGAPARCSVDVNRVDLADGALHAPLPFPVETEMTMQIVSKMEKYEAMKNEVYNRHLAADPFSFVRSVGTVVSHRFFSIEMYGCSFYWYLLTASGGG